MLGATEIDNFWLDVEHEMQQTAQDLTPEQRVRAILRYRNALAGAEVTNMVYHKEPSEVARQVIDGRFADQ